MDQRLIKIRKLVQKKFNQEYWQYHMLPMIKRALQLAKFYKVDKEMVELAALLHDIGRAKSGDKDNHHFIGATMVEKILKKFKYDQKIIDEIKHCIESHRSLKGPEPKTLMAKIIANADAMAHFNVFPVLIYYRGKKYNFEETIKWVRAKVERNWLKKITLPKAKKLVEKKYLAIKLLLKDFN